MFLSALTSKPSLKTLLFLALWAVGCGAHAELRRSIVMVGSSTVYPFSSYTAEYFGLSTKYPSPRVESTGTGGGFKFFCQGIGLKYPDISNASRRIKESEIEQCRKNGVDSVFEVKLGLDSIVLIRNPDTPLPGLSLRELYLALARWIPDENDQALIENPHKYFSDISPKLPKLPIRVLGPPPTSGTRDSFVELVLEKSCAQSSLLLEIKESDENEFERYCKTMREDGAFVESGENDNLILRKVSDSRDGTLGITGFNFYIQNRDMVDALEINDVPATRDSISSGAYPISRPLFMYVKNIHIGLTPGLKLYIELFLSDFIIGAQGRLYDLGLITPDHSEIEDMRERWRQTSERMLDF